MKLPKANSEEITYRGEFFKSDIPKLKKLIIKKNHVGLANDTKWKELINHFRHSEGMYFIPNFRYKRIDCDYIFPWDSEWYYHLPFPFISVHWFDMSVTYEEFQGHLIKPKTHDFSEDVEAIVKRIGFEYILNTNVLRIFGYTPKDYTDFDVQAGT